MERSAREAMTCPICGEPMDRRAVDGVVIDFCEEHGCWLDEGELERLKSAARARSGRALRRKAGQLRRRSRLEGALLGLWSLFLDLVPIVRAFP